MITGPLDLYLTQIVGKTLFGAVVAYFLFSLVVLRQTRLLIATIQTNLSRLVLAVVVFNLMVGFLGVVAATGLVF